MQIESREDAVKNLDAKLKSAGQDHVIALMRQLEPVVAERLRSQLAEIDLAQLMALASDRDQSTDWAALAGRAEPPPAVRLNQVSNQETRRAVDAGEAALRGGKLAAILVAGGQGTRLGYDHPKGMFTIGPVSGRSLFQMHIDRLQAVMRRYGVSIPLYIMTSPATDEETKAFLSAHQNFGLPKELLIVFCQGTMPAVDAATGKVLVNPEGQLALSPDGHGGVVRALQVHGCLNHARSLGVETFFYAQIDNPLVPLCDPALIGHHLAAESEMTTQVVRKRFAKEKVGNVVAIDGKIQIIEYSDLPDQAAEAVDAHGELRLWAGNIAVHLFQLHFLETVSRAESLPFHRALKAVPFLDADGSVVEPKQPNAIKFERFVFDLLPLAQRSIVVEGDAAEVFAPVKNASGAAVDTPELCQQAIIRLHRKWLAAAGASVNQDVRVEISPAWALDAAEVAVKLPVNTIFAVDTFLR